MVETIFDLINSLGGEGIWFWYIFFIILIGVWANSKNRNYWKWMGAALLFSPLLTGLVLLFSGKIEKKEGETQKIGVKKLKEKRKPQINYEIPSFTDFIKTLLLILILFFIFGSFMTIIAGIIISNIKNILIGTEILFTSLLIFYISNKKCHWITKIKGWFNK